MAVNALRLEVRNSFLSLTARVVRNVPHQKSGGKRNLAIFKVEHVWMKVTWTV